MRKPQGMTINYSMVRNENGEHEVGFRYNDTDGIDIDRHYSGAKEEDIYTQLYTDVIEEMSKQYDAIREKKALEAAKAKKAAAAKAQPTQSYEEIIEDLRRKIEKIEEENKSLKIDNDILNKRIKDNLNQTAKRSQKKVEEKYNPYKMLEELFNSEDYDEWVDSFNRFLKR